MKRPVVLALALALVPTGCVVQEPGLGGPLSVEPPGPDAAPSSFDASRLEDAPVPPPSEDAGPPPKIVGAPRLVGCADGTREGFLDLTPFGWPDIAACAGGFSVPGLSGSPPSTTRCARGAGNSAANPSGVGCAAADLCADGWHVCRGPLEVAERSPSGCESAAPPGVRGLFAVETGAEPAGHCAAGGNGRNDVHGCGSFGQPESGSCFPLDRRLGVTDCMRSGGAWHCGDSHDHLRESVVVWKPGAELGGVLCCRDP